MYISISHHNPQPLYQQIVDQFKEGIADGRLSPNTPVPSIRVLAKELRVSVITVKRAYTELEQEGYLITKPASGSFIAPLEQTQLQQNQLKETKEQLIALINKNKAFGISIDDLIQILKELEEQDE